MIPQKLRLSPVVETRYSPRAFLETPLPQGYLDLLLEAARRSPSAGNTQPWRFIYAEKASNPEGFAKMADLLTGNNRIWAPKAPILFCAVAQEINAEGKKQGSAHYDVGQAVAWLTVQATELGLFVHQMGGFDRPRAKAELGIPEEFAPVVMFTVGFLGKPDSLPEDLQKREVERSTRKPLSEIAAVGHFPA